MDERFTDWRTRGSLDALRRAADLCRGPFQDSFCLPDSAEFDLWARQQRERWEPLTLQTLAALVDVLALDGDYGLGHHATGRFSPGQVAHAWALTDCAGGGIIAPLPLLP